MPALRILLLLIFALPAQAQPDTQFDITGQPSPADWEYFFKLDDPTRMKLWVYHQNRGRDLSKWSWEWRLAWIRTCIKSDQDYCAKVLDQALADNALVVRAEAATRLGSRYAASKNRDIVAKLAALYKDKRNIRNGKPLYIQQRILYAISEIGGEFALKTGARLAANHNAMNQYWSKLRRL